MRRFLSIREASRWTLVVAIVLAIGGPARAQGVRPGIVGPRPTVVQPVIGPDLTVVVNPPTFCNQISFTAILSPGTPAPPGVLVPVKVRAFDFVFRNRVTVGEVVLMIPATGGAASAAIGWPMPADASFQPDFSNPIILAVDPDNQVQERNEGNNLVGVTGTCVG